jgi:hypothetical protein
MRPLQLALSIAAGILFSALFTFAWSGPSSSPPNGNVDAPINVGITAHRALPFHAYSSVTMSLQARASGVADAGRTN